MCPDVTPLTLVSHLYGKEDGQTEEREDNTEEGRKRGQRVGKKREDGRKEGKIRRKNEDDRN